MVCFVTKKMVVARKKTKKTPLPDTDPDVRIADVKRVPNLFTMETRSQVASHRETSTLKSASSATGVSLVRAQNLAVRARPPSSLYKGTHNPPTSYVRAFRLTNTG